MQASRGVTVDFSLKYFPIRVRPHADSVHLIRSYASLLQRLERFLERRRVFEDPSGEVPPFLYGSHYSNAGVVLFYLIRMEPYASCSTALQGGKVLEPHCIHVLRSTARSCIQFKPRCCVTSDNSLTTLTACFTPFPKRGATAYPIQRT